MTIVEIISIVSAAFSTALAIFAIWQANDSRRETQQNSAHIGEVLKEIEGNSVMIKEYVARNQQDMREYIGQTQKSLMDMQKDLVTVFTKRLEADIPQRLSPVDQFAMTLMNAMAEKPEEFIEFMRKIQESQAVMRETPGLEESASQEQPTSSASTHQE
jgi:hypothetical protein